MADPPLARTPLYDLHRSLGAKLVPFAGYEMPVQYPDGILAEHLHTRAQAGLFDVSHMGQVRIDGADAARALEALVPGDIVGLAPGRMRYTLFTNDRAGILDDLMVTSRGDHLFLVVNAACKAADIAHLQRHLAGVTPLPDRALLALQGPVAATVLDRLAPGVARLGFMSAAPVTIETLPCFVSRSGYAGEDGFEISVPAEGAERLARRLLAEPEVKPVGLGARDTLRLEGKLSLYGNDLTDDTTPLEADLGWVVKFAAGDFIGKDALLAQRAAGPARKLVGFEMTGRGIARHGYAIHRSNGGAPGEKIGEVTSGGPAPTLEKNIGMGYVPAGISEPGTQLQIDCRGKLVTAEIVKGPFYKRGQ